MPVAWPAPASRPSFEHPCAFHDVAELPRAAVAVFEECVRRFPSSANAHGGLAEAAHVAGDRVAAILCCQKARALDPNHDTAVNLLEQLEQSA